MYRVLDPGQQRSGSIAAVAFEGAEHGAGVSFFKGHLSPGQGPGLHSHPYAETCIVLSGTVALEVDGEQVVAGQGDVIVIGPGSPHGFRAVGDQWLDMVCIHASDRFVIDRVEKAGRG